MDDDNKVLLGFIALMVLLSAVGIVATSIVESNRNAAKTEFIKSGGTVEQWNQMK